MNELVFKSQKGNPVTTSLLVAEKFEKEQTMSSREMETLKELHSYMFKISDVLNDCLKMTNLYSEDISFYYDINNLHKATLVMGGVSSYRDFLLKSNLLSEAHYDFINIGGELFFGISMFNFYENGNYRLHKNAFALFYADRYVVNIKNTEYYPLWMLRCICEDSFNQHIELQNTHLKNQKIQETYLIKDTSSGHVKIGKSADVQSRMVALSTGNPTLKLLMVIDRDVESELHAQYETKRFSGEWFSLSSDDLIDIYNKYQKTR